jgi:flagellin-like hook-associated protein FlgL
MTHFLKDEDHQAIRHGGRSDCPTTSIKKKVDDMESLSLSHSVVNNLNATLAENTQIQRHLQTGRKIINNYEDSGGLGSIARLNSSVLRNQAVQQNLQNALSFTQSQDGALTVVGKILSRSSELKTKFESTLIDQRTKKMYDEEFGEIQKQLRQMGSNKWNGVSLFSVGATNVLLGTANDPHNLNANNGRSGIAIQRSQIFDSFKITKIPEAVTAAADSGGGPDESVTTINLKGPTGEITWWQWPYSAPDNFKAVQGSEVLHDKTYGTAGTALLNNGKVLAGAPGSNASPGNMTKNIDVIPFGQTPGNSSKTIKLIVNESGQTTTNTGWEMEYKIEYDPYPVSMIDSSKTWSLVDFDMTDFETFQDVLTTARAQNGAEQSRIKHELDELQTKQVGLEGALENADGLDYSLAMARYSKSRDQLHLTTNLVSAAREMETVLYTDFLNE